jgi:hypothetical protein
MDARKELLLDVRRRVVGRCGVRQHADRRAEDLDFVAAAGAVAYMRYDQQRFRRVERAKGKSWK